MKRFVMCTAFVSMTLVVFFALQHSKVGFRAAATPSRSSVAPAPAQVSAAYGSLPLSFELNRGQTDSRVHFLSRGNGYNLFLTPNEAVLSLHQPTASTRPAVVRMSLVGANHSPQVRGVDELPGRSAYFIGGDPSRWHADIPNYSRVQYHDVFPGVDLVYYGHQGRLEYDFVLAPGADPSHIRLAFTGAQKMRLDQGDVVLNIPGGDVRLHQPILYQERAGERVPVDGHFILTRGREVAFRVGPYDKRAALVIDPSLVYSTYLGGSNLEKALGIASDDKGNAYVTGSSASADFPTTAGAFQPKVRGTDTTAFVAKLNSAGTALLYSTYLGGSSSDVGHAIAVNEKEEAFVAGATYSSDFPTTAEAAQRMPGGGRDAFVAKLSADGSRLLYATYLGGTGDEEARGIALDQAGEAHVAGVTESDNFPVTANAAIKTASCRGGGVCSHGFVSKLSADGSRWLYSTVLGGSANDFANAIAVDRSGAAYIAGHTYSSDFPRTMGALQASAAAHSATALIQQGSDAFVTKLSTNGAFLYSGRLGGSGNQRANAIAVDLTGSVYITGRTDSVDFPTTAHALSPSPSGRSGSAFIAKLNPMGSALTYSTYLGGGNGDEGMGIAVDAMSRVSVAGSTSSATFVTTPGALQRTLAGTSAAFLSRLDAQGATLTYSTLLSGSKADVANAVALDGNGNVYLAGNTESKNFPVSHALHGTLDSQGSAFVTKFAFPPPSAIGTLSPNPLNYAAAFGTTSAAQSSTLTNSGTTNMSLSSIVLGGTNAADFTVQSPTGACTNTTVLAASGSCTITAVYTPRVAGGETATVTITDNALNSPQTLVLTGQGTGPFVGLTPASLTFQNQKPGTASTAQKITLNNSGSSALTGIKITVTGTNLADFGVTTSPSTNCGGSVAAGASCTISVVFTPGATGVRTAAINIADNAFNTPQSVPLLGNPPVAKLTPTKLTAFTATQGTVAHYQLLTLSNTAQYASLNLASISLGTATANYQQANNCPTGGALAPSTSCTITVTFAPTGTGTLTGTLTITDNSLNVTGSKQKVSLTGTASVSGPALAVSATSLTFSSMLQGSGTQSSQKTVVVTNKGLTNMNVSLSVGNANFTVVPATTSPCGASGTNTTLTPGTTCNAAVVFNPTYTAGQQPFTGDRDAVLTITNNSGVTGTVQSTVALRGTATGIVTASLCVKGSNPCSTILNFPATPQTNPVTISAAQTVTLKNTGNINLYLSNHYIGFTSDFSLFTLTTNNCSNGQVLAPAASCDIGITFNPSVTRVTGPRVDALRVFTNGNNTQNNFESEITLVGQATGAGLASVSKTSFAFPSTAIGNISARQTVVLSNTGSSPLTLQNIFFQSAEFQLPTSASNACVIGSSLAPGTNCNIDMDFAPSGTVNGPRSDVLTIQDCDNNFCSNSAQDVYVTGTASGGSTTLSQTVSPAGLAFGTQTLNTLTPQTVTVTNTNTVNMNVSVGAANASEYLVSGNCSGVLGPSASCTAFVTFDPAIIGSRNSLLAINTSISGAAGTQRIPLTGTGAGTVSFSPSPGTLTFPSTAMGSFSPSQTITLTNNGTVPATINNIYTSFSEVNTAVNDDFQEINNCNPASGIKIQPGSSCTIVVFFNPQNTGVTGTRTGNLVVYEQINSVVNVLQVVPLSGTVSTGAPQLVITPATGLSFLDQTFEQGGVGVLYTLSNTGTAPLIITNWGTSNGDFASSNIDTNCGINSNVGIPPGGSCTAYVIFTPFSYGVRTGHLYVETNSGNTPSFQSVLLNGFGTQ